MKVTKDSKVELDNKVYLLEEGDEISLNEGIASALLSMINKIIPIDVFKEIDPKFQSIFANILKDPEKAQIMAKTYKENPDFLKMFS